MLVLFFPDLILWFYDVVHIRFSMKILESFQGPLMQNVLMETYEQVSFEPGVDHLYGTSK